MANDNETRAMSRLLTHGATMLHRACDDCGSPLLRYEGEVVCAVCDERARSAPAEEEQDTEASTEPEGNETSPLPEEGHDEKEEVEGDGSNADWREDTASELRTLAHRLASEANEENEVPRINSRLDALERTVGLIERVERGTPEADE